VFVVGISINLARGRKLDCHCFGKLHSAPAGWKTLARNAVLAVVAGFVLWEGYDGARPSALSWVGALSTVPLLSLLGGVLVLALLAGQWWFLVHLLRQNGRLLVRLETLEGSIGAGNYAAPSTNGSAHAPQPPAGLPVGQEAPRFSLKGLHGDTLTLEALCAPGKTVIPVAGGAEGVRGLLAYAVGERAQLPILSQQPQAQGQPCPNCGKGHAAGPTVPAAQNVGEEAPEVKLPDLEGHTVELADFRG